MTAEIISALEELMEKYNELHEAWISYHGNDDEFNEWFTAQVPGLSEIAQ